jgi:hypothetical protein
MLLGKSTTPTGYFIPKKSVLKTKKLDSNRKNAQVSYTMEKKEGTTCKKPKTGIWKTGIRKETKEIMEKLIFEMNRWLERLKEFETVGERPD